MTKKIATRNRGKIVYCKKCDSAHVLKAGTDKTKTKKRYRCKDCGSYFVLGDNRYNMEKYPIEKREEVIRGYLSKTSIRGLEYTFGIKNTLISKWVKSCAKNVERLEKL
ncbi:transposase [Bacilli bacterium]|nr:transposase [Bacilli bacterium]